MKVKERLKLILPLAIVSVLAVLLNSIWDYDGLLINLGTEIAGIVITVIYVEILFERYQERKWSKVTDKLNDEVLALSNIIVSSARTAVGIDPQSFLEGDIFKLSKLEPIELAFLNQEGYKKFIKPSLRGKVNGINSKDWNLFFQNLTNAHNLCINYQKMYNSISSPEQINTIMTIDKGINGLLTQYITWPDVISESVEDLKSKNDYRTIELRESILDFICRDLNELVDILYNEVSQIQVRN